MTKLFSFSAGCTKCWKDWTADQMSQTGVGLAPVLRDRRR